MIREGGPAAKGGKGKRKGRSAEPRAIKRRFKDSVFCDLFPRARYTIGLYRELHPEDVVATEEHVDIVTISNVLVDAPYNDLGFAVGDRVMVLVEAQSAWTPNIALRAHMYYAQTLRDWSRPRRRPKSWPRGGGPEGRALRRLHG